MQNFSICFYLFQFWRRFCGYKDPVPFLIFSIKIKILGKNRDDSLGSFVFISCSISFFATNFKSLQPTGLKYYEKPSKKSLLKTKEQPGAEEEFNTVKLFFGTGLVVFVFGGHGVKTRQQSNTHKSDFFEKVFHNTLSC